jgi:putative ABC transport system permease protein
MPSIPSEFGFALRVLRKSPAFGITAIVTLALGIGASTAIFSVVNAVLLEPLPYKDPEKLAIVWVDLRARPATDFPFSGSDYKDLLERGTTFSSIAGFNVGRIAMSDDPSKPEMAKAVFATSNLFSVLGVQPALGRLFVEGDGTPQPPEQEQNAAAPAPQFHNIVVLSHGFWQRRYGGDSTIVGRTIPMFGTTAQVVGILAPDVQLVFPTKSNIDPDPDIWIARRDDFASAPRSNHFLRVIARVKDGATFATAQSQMDRFAADLRQDFAVKKTADLNIRVEPMLDDVVRMVRRPLVALLGAVGFVLLIACANVANLLLVRASARERELAVRSALGGSRFRLVRQMLSESLVLAFIGGTLGVLLAIWGVDLLVSLAPRNLPRMDGVQIDGRVLAFSVAISVVAAVIFGLVPAIRASQPNVGDLLRGGRAASQLGGQVLRNGVVVAEVALSFVLLVGTGLMLRSFIAVMRIDPGYRTEGVLTFNLQNERPRNRDETMAFVNRLRARLLAIPGVTHVASSSRVPLDLTNNNGRWATEVNRGDDTQFRQAEFFFVHTGFFESFNTRLIEGRLPTDADFPQPLPDLGPNPTPQQIAALDELIRTTARPVVVDEQLARTAFPGQSAVGKRIWSRTGGPDNTPFEIIGVVQHQRHTTVVTDEREALYFPSPIMNGKWVVRSSRGLEGLLPQVRAAIAEIDPAVPIGDVNPMGFYLDRAMAATQFALVMLAIFAAIAVLLACVGLYGVLASSIRQRTAEIGVRMAFGAPSNSIFKLVIGEGMRLSAAGVVLGAGGALLLTRVIRSMLVGVKPTDPVTFVLIAGLFVSVAALASWIPASRAAGLDPNVALRHE